MRPFQHVSAAAAAIRAVTCAVLAGAAACADAPGPPDTPNPERSGVRIVIITHGQSSDPFWSIVSNGAHDAARDLGVRVEYQAPVRFDMIEMSQLIDAARASRPAGLIVSIPDGDALASAIRAAVADGIPVITINSGDDFSRSLGALAHVGQPEYDAGLAAGERLAVGGVTRALCINHEVGNLALDRRCQGFADALSRSSGTVRVVAANLADPDDAQQRIAGALAADPAIDGILTLGPNAIDPALAAIASLARGTIAFATFDLTTRALEALRDGRLHFAIDQQPYLQGYLPVVLLVNYIETRTMPGGGRVIATGPTFVTREHADEVMALTARGIR